MATKPTLESLREQIIATQTEITAIGQAPIPLAEAEANMGTLLDGIGAAR